MMRIRLRDLFVWMLLLSAAAVQGRPLRLRAAVPAGEGFVAAGEVLAWLDARGEVLRTRTLATPLAALAERDGLLFAVDVRGREVLRLDADGTVAERCDPGAKGRIRSLAGDGRVLFAVTDAGEILRSADGRTWTRQDFNADYAGYYARMDFRAVAAGGGGVMVAGLDPDGRLALFTSSGGTVWSAREPDYRAQGRSLVLETEPMSLSYDPLQDRFFLAGSGGVLLTLPGCAHCNRLDRFPTDTLYARIPSGFSALLLGSGGFVCMENETYPNKNDEK